MFNRNRVNSSRPSGATVALLRWASSGASIRVRWFAPLILRYLISVGKHAQWKGKMNAIRKLALIGLFFGSCCFSHAITNTVIYVSGTNIVLSWPSVGYETYLIQYRQTLNATDSWSQLTNDYYANSTNMTTYTLYGLASPPAGSGSGGGTGGGSPPSPDMAMSRTAMSDIPMAMPTNGSGSAVPLAIYPPGFDLSGFTIFDPTTGESVSGSGYTISASPMASGATPMDGGGGFTPDDLTNDVSGPETGFFRVFHIPDWLVSFDGYQFGGPTFIPVDYAAPDAPTNEIESSTILINGQQSDYAQFIPDDIGGTTYWGQGIYFDRMPNGTNTIQLITSVRQSDTVDDNTINMVFSNAPQNIVVANSVTYTNWDDLIWQNTNYTFQAQSSTTNVNWEIDIYDVNGDYVNSGTGYSSDGNISWTWDLTDYTGASRSDSDTDPDFYPYLTINPSESGGDVHANSGSSPSPMPAVAAPYPSQGGWIVCYMDDFYTDGTTNYSYANSYYSSGIDSIVGAAAEWSLPVEKFPIAYGSTYTQTNRNTSWSNLASWIYYPQYRNLYYSGHGSANVIGCDENTVDSSNNITGGIFLPNSKAGLTASAIHDNVAFNPNGARPYRFVFLDGCNTANGNFAAAFGIPQQALTGGWYFSDSNTRHIRPSAFMGWNVTVGGDKSWGTVQGYWTFREYWIADWANTDQEILDNAIDIARDTSGWVAPAMVDTHLVTTGDTELEYLQYNYGGDW